MDETRDKERKVKVTKSRQRFVPSRSGILRFSSEDRNLASKL